MGRMLEKDWLTSYLEYTSGQESPRNFHFWTGLSIIGGALRRNVFLDRTYYTLFPNMYVILVAASAACRKSVATGIGMKILKQTSLRKKLEGKNDGDIRILYGKGTPEGLIQLMAEAEDEMAGTVICKDSSIYIYSSELQTFLSSARYTADLIPLLTDLYQGHDIWEDKTKTAGHVVITNVAPSFLGATTPESLAKCIPTDSFGLGFMGRIIFIVERRSKKIAWPKKTAEIIALEEKLINDLIHISRLRGEFQVSNEAYQWFEDWYNKYSPGNYDRRLAGYFERKPDHLLKVAMLLAVNNSDELTLKTAHMKTALDVINVVEAKMPAAFQYVGTEQYAVGEEILTEILKRRGRILHRELVSVMRMRVRNLNDIIDNINILVDAGSVEAAALAGNKYYQFTNSYKERLKREGVLARKLREEQRKQGNGLDLEDAKKEIDDFDFLPSVHDDPSIKRTNMADIKTGRVR